VLRVIGQVQCRTVTARLRPMVYTLGFLPAETIVEYVDAVADMDQASVNAVGAGTLWEGRGRGELLWVRRDRKYSDVGR
jgi:hypothetical protein